MRDEVTPGLANQETCTETMRNLVVNKSIAMTESTDCNSQVFGTPSCSETGRKAGGFPSEYCHKKPCLASSPYFC
jgi:hypothetical protein